MKRNTLLVITSLVSLVLLTVHLADDVVRGMFPTGVGILYAAMASGLLLYGILAHSERLAGVLTMLVVSLCAIAMPVLHTRGKGVSISAFTPGGFFFVWTILVLGMLGLFSFILSLRALWSLRSVPPRE
jgi:hypothetical protein